MFAPNAGPFANFNADAVVAKMNSRGLVVWSHQLGSDGSDGANAIALDQSGNLFVAGITSGDLAGPNHTTFAGFLFKYDPAGNVIWKRQISLGSGHNLQTNGIATDAAGNVFVVGSTDENLGSHLPGDNTSDEAFVCKFNAAGDLLWTQPIIFDNGHGLATDSAGNAFATGLAYFAGPILVKLSPDGAIQSAQSFPDLNGLGLGISTDGSGNMYLTGTTYHDNPQSNNLTEAYLVKVRDVPEPNSALATAIGAISAWPLLRQMRRRYRPVGAAGL